MMGLYKLRKALPPLNSIKAFEAVARLGSITQAASELNVTPSAVSQQIKNLEECIGRKLFHKNKHNGKLLDESQQAFLDISHALDLIAQSFHDKEVDTRRVAISTLSSLASHWLNPQFSTLLAKKPDLELYIDCSPRFVDFSRESFDFSIRFGRGQYAPLCMDRLFTERFQAVCSPLLKTKIEEKIKNNQLDSISFICDTGMQSGEYATWSNWMERRGIPPKIPERKIVCTDTNISIDAAVRGSGLLLGRHVLVAPLLEQGILVALEEESFETDLGYFLLYPSLAKLTPVARMLRSWILIQSRDFCKKYNLSN